MDMFIYDPSPKYHKIKIYKILIEKINNWIKVSKFDFLMNFVVKLIQIYDFMVFS